MSENLTAGNGPLATVGGHPINVDHRAAAEESLFRAIRLAAQTHDSDGAEKFANALRVIYRDQ